MAGRPDRGYHDFMSTSPISRTLVILLFAGAAVVRFAPETHPIPIHLLVLGAIGAGALLVRQLRRRPQA